MTQILVGIVVAASSEGVCSVYSNQLEFDALIIQQPEGEKLGLGDWIEFAVANGLQTIETYAKINPQLETRVDKKGKLSVKTEIRVDEPLAGGKAKSQFFGNVGPFFKYEFEPNTRYEAWVRKLSSDEIDELKAADHFGFRWAIRMNKINKIETQGNVEGSDEERSDTDTPRHYTENENDHNALCHGVVTFATKTHAYVWSPIGQLYISHNHGLVMGKWIRFDPNKMVRPSIEKDTALPALYEWENVSDAFPTKVMPKTVKVQFPIVVPKLLVNSDKTWFVDATVGRIELPRKTRIDGKYYGRRVSAWLIKIKPVLENKYACWSLAEIVKTLDPDAKTMPSRVPPTLIAKTIVQNYYEKEPEISNNKKIVAVIFRVDALSKASYGWTRDDDVVFVLETATESRLQIGDWICCMRFSKPPANHRECNLIANTCEKIDPCIPTRVDHNELVLKTIIAVPDKVPFEPEIFLACDDLNFVHFHRTDLPLTAQGRSRTIWARKMPPLRFDANRLVCEWTFDGWDSIEENNSVSHRDQLVQMRHANSAPIETASASSRSVSPNPAESFVEKSDTDLIEGFKADVIGVVTKLNDNSAFAWAVETGPCYIVTNSPTNALSLCVGDWICFDAVYTPQHQVAKYTARANVTVFEEARLPTRIQEGWIEIKVAIESHNPRLSENCKHYWSSDVGWVADVRNVMGNKGDFHVRQVWVTRNLSATRKVNGGDWKVSIYNDRGTLTQSIQQTLITSTSTHIPVRTRVQQSVPTASVIANLLRRVMEDERIINGIGHANPELFADICQFIVEN